MAVTPVKLSITKSMTWMGRTEEFSNVYTIYGLDVADESAVEALIDSAVAAEKNVHSANVTFVRGQVYSFGDVGPNFMYGSKLVSGVGSASPATGMYRECAVMLRARMARTYSLSRSNQPYLRKYYHTQSMAGLSDITGTNAKTFITPGAPYSTLVAWINNPGPGLSVTNDDGDEPEGNWELCTFLEHRQFHRGRKEY